MRPTGAQRDQPRDAQQRRVHVEDRAGQRHEGDGEKPDRGGAGGAAEGRQPSGGGQPLDSAVLSSRANGLGAAPPGRGGTAAGRGGRGTAGVARPPWPGRGGTAGLAGQLRWIQVATDGRPAVSTAQSRYPPRTRRRR